MLVVAGAVVLVLLALAVGIVTGVVIVIVDHFPGVCM